MKTMAEHAVGRAILEAKCPRCREGKMFTHPWYRISKFYSVNKHCPSCNFRFEIEPGFFFGAMYMSYAFIVVIFTIVGLALYYLFNPGILVYIIGINLVVLLLLPLIFRYSRVLYLYLFGGVSYEKDEG